MTLDRTFRIPEHIVARDIGGETVILDLQQGTYCGLNAVGARLWMLLEQGNTLNETLTSMLDEYDVEPDRLKTDLLALTDELTSKNLLTESPSHAG